MPRRDGPSANPTSLCSGGTFPTRRVHRRHLLRCQPLPVSFTHQISAYSSGPQTNIRKCCMISRAKCHKTDDPTIPWSGTLRFPRLKPPSAGFVPASALTVPFGDRTNQSCCWVGPQRFCRNNPKSIGLSCVPFFSN